MLKTTAFYISFLGLLSVIYHTIYWGQFDTDIFQFIALQDFITGIAYPLRTALAFAVVFLVLIALTHPLILKNDPTKRDLRERVRAATGVAFEDCSDVEAWVEKAHDQNPAAFAKAVVISQQKRNHLMRGVMYSFAIVAVVSLLGYFLLFSTNAWLASWTAFVITCLVLALSQFAYGRFENILDLKSVKEEWIAFIDEFIITLMLFLPINAALAGYTEAQRVLTRETYKFVASAELPLPAGTQVGKTLIYLGKVGVSYFFLSSDLKHHFVVPVDKVPVLNYQVYTAP